MLSAWLRGNKSVVPLRIEIEVEVETQVKVDYAHSPTSVVFEDERPSLETYSHDPSRPFSGTAPLSPRADSYQSSSYLKQHNHIMSLPRSDYDPRRVCVNPCPNLTFGKHRRSIGVYLAGALFALANWIFLDAAVLSAHAKPKWGDEAPVHISFVDWVPGILSLLGYLVINCIDKDRLRGRDGFGDGDSRAVWLARLTLFIGLALMAGGLAGSVTILVLKYILPGYTPQFTYYGYASVSQNVALMLSAAGLWIAQDTSNEYEYNLTL